MKRLLIATAMLALTASNALAYDDYEWDCGNDLIVTGWKDQLHFYTHEDHKYFRSITRIKDAGKTTLKRKGNAAVRIEWDFTDHPIRITVNDMACHSMSEMDWNREGCRRRETADACERVRLQEKAERNDRISCKDDPASVACENVRKHKQWLQERKEECRKIPTLLICKKSAIVSRVRMRHDRPCDKAQDKPDYKKLNPKAEMPTGSVCVATS